VDWFDLAQDRVNNFEYDNELFGAMKEEYLLTS
jgi:hypothetical protein